MMMNDNQERRLMQLALFEEYLKVPRWCDLNETTRGDVVRRLAQLLGSVQDGNRGRPEKRGGQDE